MGPAWAQALSALLAAPCPPQASVSPFSTGDVLPRLPDFPSCSDSLYTPKLPGPDSTHPPVSTAFPSLWNGLPWPQTTQLPPPEGPLTTSTCLYFSAHPRPHTHSSQPRPARPTRKVLIGGDIHLCVANPMATSLSSISWTLTIQEATPDFQHFLLQASPHFLFFLLLHQLLPYRPPQGKDLVGACCVNQALLRGWGHRSA